MEVFRFHNPHHPMLMESGQIINGLTSKTWIERYGPPGEFTFEAPLRSGIRQKLPIGSFVSHVDTKEVMIVENHALSAKKDDEVHISVTGSSFETITDERIVGGNAAFPLTDIRDYRLKKGFSWHQLVNLIRDHIDYDKLLDKNNEIPHVDVSQVVDQTGYVTTVPAIDRLLARGSVYEHIQELLKLDNLGIRTIRPSGDGKTNNTLIQIHRGVDRSKDVIFSYGSDEIDDLDYLFSRKKFKNCALVTGKWVEVVVFGTEVKEDRRWMHVSATDVDDEYDSIPKTHELELVEIALWYRGLKALNEQNNIELKKADIAHNAVKYKFRKDYDLGDLIGISGGYLTDEKDATKVRVVEYLESEDENGRSSYPTLALDPPTPPQ